jgi:hypothetical protein
MRKLLTVTTAVLCLVLPKSSLAAEAKQTEAEKLRQEVAALMKRLDKMEHAHHGHADIKIGEHCQRNVKSPAEGKMKVTLSGQVDKAIAAFDNGNRSSIQTVDNDLSSSRFDINAENKLSDCWVLGAQYQAEVLDNSTRFAQIRGSANTQSAASPLTRVFEFKAKYLPWRTEFQLGRGYTASNYIQNYADWISSSTVATDGAKGIAEVANSIQFFDKTANALSTTTSGTLGNNNTPGGIAIGNVFDQADGLGRRNRARLNIGPWSGFTLSTSHEFDQTDNADVALRYAGEFNCWLIAAAIAYCENHAIAVTQQNFVPEVFTSYRQVHGSIGFLAPFGVSAMYAGVQRDWRWPGARDGRYHYEKLGYEAWLNEYGKTAIAIYAMQTKNMFFLFTQPGAPTPPAGNTLLQLDNRGKAFGVAFVQHLDRVATDLYVLWTNYKYTQSRAPGAHRFNKINVGLIGARLKF